MRLYLYLRYNGINYQFGFLNGVSNSCISLKDIFIIYLYKNHNHDYYFKAFFYQSKRIYSDLHFTTKSKMYSAVQKLLQEELYHV